MDGPDYRATARPVATVALSEGEADALLRVAAGPSTDDAFEEVLAHLRRVHPVQYGPLVEGIDTVVVRGMRTLRDQNAALAWVALVDELYDAELVFGATGCGPGS